MRGVFEDDGSPLLIKADSKQVAAFNTLSLMYANEQIYSREKNFKIINHDGNPMEMSMTEVAADPLAYVMKKRKPVL